MLHAPPRPFLQVPLANFRRKPADTLGFLPRPPQKALINKHGCLFVSSATEKNKTKLIASDWAAETQGPMRPRARPGRVWVRTRTPPGARRACSGGSRFTCGEAHAPGLFGGGGKASPARPTVPLRLTPTGQPAPPARAAALPRPRGLRPEWARPSARLRGGRAGGVREERASQGSQLPFSRTPLP